MCPSGHCHDIYGCHGASRLRTPAALPQALGAALAGPPDSCRGTAETAAAHLGRHSALDIPVGGECFREAEGVGGSRAHSRHAR